MPGPRKRRATSAAVPFPSFGTLAAAVGLVTAAILAVHWPTWNAFFNADDLLHLEEAAGFRERGLVPWRVITQAWYFEAMFRAVGPSPHWFHAVNVVLHTLNSMLLAIIALRIGANARVALLAAIVFGASSFAVTVIWRAVTINDLVALFCSELIALLSLRRSVTALMPYPVAMLSKESAILMPLLFAVDWSDDRVRWRPRHAIGAAIAVGLAIAAFLVLRAMAIAPSGSAYEMKSGWNMAHNAMTYAAWEVNLWSANPDLVRSYDASAWRIGLPVCLVVLAGFMAFRSQRRTIAFGAAWWLLAIAPVLPLQNSTYAHYAYLAHAGASLVAAAIVTGLVEHGLAAIRAPSWATAMCIALAAVYCVQAGALVRARDDARAASGLALDSFVRSMEVGQAAIESIRQSAPSDAKHIAIFNPTEGLITIGARSGRRYYGESRGYDVVQSVLDDGRALRVFMPGVDSTAYVHRWRTFGDSWDVFVPINGVRMTHLGRGREAARNAGVLALESGWNRTADEVLSVARSQWPDDAELRFAYALTQVRLGRRSLGLDELHELVRRSPNDPFAVRANEILAAETSP